MRVLSFVVVIGCASPAAPQVEALRVTRPVGAVELVPVPDEALAFAWTATTAGEVALAWALVPDQPANPTVRLPTVDAAPGHGDEAWPLPSPAPAPGTYRLVATAIGPDDAPLAMAAAPAIVMVQGLVFRDPALAFAGADAERDIWLTATNGRPIAVELFVTPAGQAAPRTSIATATIASDLAPVGRVLGFPGTARDGTPLPAGTYDAHVAVTPPDRPVGYQVDGLTITWAP